MNAVIFFVACSLPVLDVQGLGCLNCSQLPGCVCRQWRDGYDERLLSLPSKQRALHEATPTFHWSSITSRLNLFQLSKCFIHPVLASGPILFTNVSIFWMVSAMSIIKNISPRCALSSTMCWQSWKADVESLSARGNKPSYTLCRCGIDSIKLRFL